MGVGCGVAAFLGSEMVLSPVVSAVSLLQGVGVGCGVAAFLGFDMVLSPVVSLSRFFVGGWVLVVAWPPYGLGPLTRFGSFHVQVCVGWCGRFLGPSSCLDLY